MSGRQPLLLPEDAGRWTGLEERLSFVQGAISLAVSMIGTGIVSFPYGFALCGYVLGPMALIFLCVLAHVSYVSLIRCTAKMQVASYGGLLLSVPKAWSHYTNISLWLLLVLATAAYVLITADIIRSVLLGNASEVPLALRDPVVFAVILLAVYPLCLLKSMHGLSVISAYCSFAIIAVVCLIVGESLRIWTSSPPPESSAATASTEPRSVLLAMPILGCAMFGHMNVSQVYAELRPSVKPKASLVALTACLGSAALYMVVGAVGYAAFGRSAEPDVVAQLAARGGEGGAVAAIQGLLASFIALKTPLLILPLRSLSLEVAAPEVSPAELAAPRHALLTLSLLACVYLAAVALPDLGRLLAVLGAVCVVPLCFVVPARLSWASEVPRPAARCLALAAAGGLISAFSLAAVFAP